MICDGSFQLDGGAKMDNVLEPFVALEEDKLFDHVPGDGLEVKKFNYFGRRIFTGLEEPFVISMEKDTVFWLVHIRQEDCHIAIMFDPSGKGFI